MPRRVDTTLAGLYRTLDEMGRVAVAVSGGVDSLTLAHAAHGRLGSGSTMFHAVSPAVPPAATERVLRQAEASGWALTLVRAGEFEDPAYLANPADRCFFCKSHLYRAIAGRTRDVIASGTNLDDLSDFRPGLGAAKAQGVRHPYVEARIGKALVREIATRLGLGELADLPASPCLASRVETGLRITAPALRFANTVEEAVRRRLRARDVRCRIRRTGLDIELDEAAFALVASEEEEALQALIQQLGAAGGFTGEVRFSRYRMGSAFLRS